MRYKVGLFVLSVFLILGGCKKKKDDENNGGGGGTTQVADIHGDWVGKWTSNQSGDGSLIHLSISQSEETVSIRVVFDSLYTDTFVLEGLLDKDHISGYAISTLQDTFKCVFVLSYSNDTLRGSYNFGSLKTGSWWAVKGTHLVEQGWNYFGEIAGYPNDVFYANDGTLYLTTTGGLYASSDFGVSYELLDTSNFNSVCDAGGVLYGAGYGFVLKSNDGGLTWQDITPSNFVGGSGTIIRFATDSKGCIFSGDDVYTTTDGGDTWNLHENVLPGPVQTAYVTDGDIYVGGYIPGQTFGGFVEYSQDDGVTWTDFNMPEEDSVGEVWSVWGDGTSVLIGGRKVKASSDDHDLRILLYSEDNGNYFVKLDFPGVPPHDEWIGAVTEYNGMHIGANVYPSGNVMVYKFSSSQVAVDTLQYAGGSSRYILSYNDGNLGLIINSSAGRTIVYYYKSQ